MVDDHNNLRHSSPSIEETWKTHRWENRVFAFLLAITEVNLYLWLRYKVWKNRDADKYDTLHQFRKKLALALINNQYIINDEAEDRLLRSSKQKEHKLQRCPPHAKKFEYGKWTCTAEFKYQQYRCKRVGCKKKIRTFCSCSPGVWICNDCFPIHICEVVTSDDTLG